MSGILCADWYSRQQSPAIIPACVPYLTPPQVKEPNLELLARGKIKYEPARYMTVNTVRVAASSPATPSTHHGVCAAYVRV